MSNWKQKLQSIYRENIQNVCNTKIGKVNLISQYNQIFNGDGGPKGVGGRVSIIFLMSQFYRNRYKSLY